ncbi:MAG: hypothetical protein C3F13_19355 [Anaerolineales bacterium]|nr:MAG: hypothetical protein C3F13_19355 [Anaerolineales bacterium]
MRIPPILYGALVLVIYLGTVFGFKLAGIWSVSGKVTSGGEAVQPLPNDVDTIKGWMTLEQITAVYDVSLEDLLAHFNLPDDTPASTAIKDLESEEFSVTNLRDWLQSLGISTQPGETQTPLPISPTPAVTSTATPAQFEATPLSTEHITLEKNVTGKTTFQDLLDWGVPEEIIAQIIGGDLPALNTLVKDYVTQQGIQFSTIKTALQAEVEKAK